MSDLIVLENKTKEELIQLYLESRETRDNAEAQMSVVRDEIKLRLKDDGEVWGSYTVSKTKRYTFPTCTISQAEEYGAVKTKTEVDVAVLKKLYLKGAKLPFKPEISENIIIREVIKKDVPA